MIKVGIHIPGIHDATNWYRGTGPLSHLRKRLDPTFSFDRIGEWSYSSVQVCDLAFFQRPSTAQELEAIRICKRLGVPVIVDYDDLLFDIPADNPSFRAYMNKQTQETIITIMREADCVWVSTAELKRCLQIKGAPLNERVYVVPNALDDHHLVTGARAAPPPLARRQQAVIWRGSQTHERDVMDFTPEIGDVALNSPKTSFVFVGYNPWFLTERLPPKQAICSGALPIGEFMDFLYATGAHIGMVPLHDSRFNRCKSNIAWLEMTWAGGVVLAPDWEEWRHPGVVTYRDAEDYRAGLKLLLEMEPEKRNAMHEMSWNCIKSKFVLSRVNNIRLSTMRALLKEEYWPDGWQRLHDPDEEVMALE